MILPSALMGGVKHLATYGSVSGHNLRHRTRRSSLHYHDLSKPKMGDFPNLSHCQGLREPEVFVPSLAHNEVCPIASIAATDALKTVFTARYKSERKDDPVSVRHYHDYETIDECLCQLVQQSRVSWYERMLDMNGTEN